jgi:hypothetical protein
MPLLNWQKNGLKKLSDYEMQRQLEALEALMSSPMDISSREHLKEIRDFLSTEQIQRGRDKQARMTGEIPHPLQNHLRTMSRRDLYALRLHVDAAGKLLSGGMVDVAERASRAIAREIETRRKASPKLSVEDWERINAGSSSQTQVIATVEKFFEANDGI